MASVVGNAQKKEKAGKGLRREHRHTHGVLEHARKKEKAAAPGPLDGIFVIDWTQWHAGPFAGAMLADLGAEVVHVEHPQWGDGFRTIKTTAGVSNALPKGRHMFIEDLNRNKKGITLNLASEEGREIMYDLVRGADVFLTNFRGPERVGMSYQELRSINPRLIWAHATGAGPKGPDKNLGSFEGIGFARSGAYMAVAVEDEPGILPIGWGDRITSIMTAYAILAALVARERTGVGQEINTSQLGSIMFLSGTAIMPTLWAGQEFKMVRRSEARNPMSTSYKTKDGRWILFNAMQADRYWPLLCMAVERTDLLGDPRFMNDQSRQEHYGELIEILNQVFASATYDEWKERLVKAGMDVFGPINRLSDLRDDPQVIANNYIVEWDHPDLGKMPWVGFPFELSETPARFYAAAPRLGEHTDSVLNERLGYDQQQMEELRARGVV